MRRWLRGRLNHSGFIRGTLSLLLAASGCLNDTPVTAGAPNVHATLNANIVGAMAGGTVRIRVGYRRSSQQLVQLPASPEQITVSPGSTVVLPLTVDIGACLADTRRAPEGEPGCKLVIELTLSDAAGTVVDTQTREADGAPATPGQAVDFGTVTIGIRVALVTVAPTSLSLNVSQERELTATVRDVSGAVVTTLPITWTTSDATVAQLSATTGAAVVVRALKLGTASVVATAGAKSSSQLAVNVVPPAPLIIRQHPATGCVIVGQAVTLDVDTPPAAVAWNVSNSAIATIDATTGVVTGRAVGQATVTATSGNRTGTASVCVVGPLAVAPASLSITAGRTGQITASNASGATLSYSSSAPSVATVDGTGLVRGVNVGQATITTTLTAASGGQTATTPVTVTAAAVAITPESASIALDRSVRFTAAAQDANGAVLAGVPVTWSIADGTVGGLSATSGTAVDVRALKVGTTTVRATAGGATASAQLTVTQPLPPAGLQKVSGDGVACPTRSFSCGFVVRVVDANGEPVAGASVGWSTSFGCASGSVTTSDQDGLAGAANICSAVVPGTYSQTATLLTNQQQVTFTYFLRGLSMAVDSSDFSTIHFSVTSSNGVAAGLAATVQIRAAPASDFITGLDLARTTTPATLTLTHTLSDAAPGTYLWDVIVTTTTPGLGPAVITLQVDVNPGYDVQPAAERRAATPVVRTLGPPNAGGSPAAARRPNEPRD